MSFEGSIGEIDLVRRLVDLGRERFTGAIRFERDGIIKIVYLKGGDVLSASTNDRADSVDEILLRAGKIDREHVKQALAKRKENETLGDALLGLGFITRKELAWARRVQAIGILRSVRAWSNGSYTIVADYLPKREEGTLFPLPQIIVELIVTEQDRKPIEKAMDGGSAIFTKSADFDAGFDRLGLNEEAVQIVVQVDGKRTAADVANAAGKDAFNAYKLLEALRALGLLSKLQVKDEFAFATDAVTDGEDAWTSRANELMTTADTEDLDLGVPSLDEPPVAEPAAPAAVAATLAATEPQWGYEDAQIETPRQASPPAPPPPPPPVHNSVPPPPRRTQHVAPRTLSATQTQRKRQISNAAPPPKRSRAPVFTLIVLMLIAAAGYAFWTWWSGQQAAVAQARPGGLKPAATQSTPPRVVVPTPTATQSTPPRAAVPTPKLSGAPAPSPAIMPQPTKDAAEGGGAPLKTSASPAPARTARTVASPVSSPAAGRYEAMAQEFARTASGNFTVQFELVCQTSSLAKAVQAGGANVWFVPISYRGQSCYRVFWGRFPTREAAMAAWVKIPSSIRGAKPVVVAVPKS